MSNDPQYEDPFSDPFDDQVQQDPFVEDHFSQSRPVTGPSGIVEQLPDATAVLVLGILSILGAFCYGIVGLILGIIAVAMAGKPSRLYHMNPGHYTQSSYSNLQAGKICGIIGIVLSSLIVVLVLAAFIAMANEGAF
ncbi:MAG: CCC motif membrane protein [Bacteroidota bacterium]